MHLNAMCSAGKKHFLMKTIGPSLNGQYSKYAFGVSGQRGSFQHSGKLYKVQPSTKKHRFSVDRSFKENRIGGIDHVVSIVSMDVRPGNSFS